MSSHRSTTSQTESDELLQGRGPRSRSMSSRQGDCLRDTGDWVCFRHRVTSQFQDDSLPPESFIHLSAVKGPEWGQLAHGRKESSACNRERLSDISEQKLIFFSFYGDNCLHFLNETQIDSVLVCQSATSVGKPHCGMPSCREDWHSGPGSPELKLLLLSFVFLATTENLCPKLQDFKSSHHDQGYRDCNPTLPCQGADSEP